ncbi:MAG TPA: hypothetical protein GXX46_03485 [Peptococcaceae bacterium]|nr:hypothetical protein [Peptococcaceae bacterium]
MALNIILLVIIAIIMVLLDLPGLLKIEKKNKIKVLISYFLLLLTGFTLGLLLILEREPVSPTVIIERMLNLILGIGL